MTESAISAKPTQVTTGSDAAAAPRRLDWSTRLVCGIGAIAYGVKEGGFSGLLLLFYNQVIGLPAQTVGLAIMIALGLDAVIDPFIGHVSDNFRSRWGRRHPFMYIAMVPATLAFIALWFPPSGSQPWQIAHLVGVAILTRSFISLFELPNSAMMPELTRDYDERTRLTSLRYLFGTAGGIGLGFLTFNVLLHPDATHPVGQLNPAGYHHYALVAATIMLVSMLIVSIGTHRFIPTFSVNPPRAERTARQTLRDAWRTLSNPSLAALVISALFGSMGSGLTTSLGTYLATYFWEFTAAQFSYFLIAQGVAIASAFALAGPLARRFGKKEISMVVLPLGVILLGLPVLLRLCGMFFANGTPMLMPAILLIQTTALASIYICAILSPSMMMDIVEDTQVATGRRSEGLIMASGMVVQKAISGFGIFLAGLVLTWSHFPEKARPGQVDPDIIWRLGAIYVPALLVIYALTLLALSRYRITRSHHEDNLRRLAAEAAAGNVPQPIEMPSAKPLPGKPSLAKNKGSIA